MNSTPSGPPPGPIAIMQMVSGFWVSKTLASAVELGVFSRMSGKKVRAEEFAPLFGLQPRPAEMLLSACTALGLLERQDGHYQNSALAEEFLVKGKPYYFGGVVTMLDRRLYLPWNRLTEALKNNRAQTWGEHEGIFEAISANPDEQRNFTESMHSFSIQSGKALAGAFDFSAYKQLLDIGGGSGAYCIEAARKFPHLRGAVYDLAPALEIASEKIAAANLTDRVETRPGNFFEDDLPPGFDVHLLSMVLHDWTPEKNLSILRKSFQALRASGTLIVSELMMDDDKSGPVPAALMSLNMLIETEGRNYTWTEYTEWMKQTGFENIQRVPIISPGANGLLIGSKA